MGADGPTVTPPECFHQVFVFSKIEFFPVVENTRNHNTLIFMFKDVREMLLVHYVCNGF